MHRGDLQFTRILLSGHQHSSPPFNVAAPLTWCLTFGVHSTPSPPAPISKTESRQASSLAAKEISGDDPCFFFGMVKLQLGDISIGMTLQNKFLDPAPSTR